MVLRQFSGLVPGPFVIADAIACQQLDHRAAGFRPRSIRRALMESLHVRDLLLDGFGAMPAVTYAVLRWTNCAPDRRDLAQ